jgi:sialate O-acetylesterase
MTKSNSLAPRHLALLAAVLLACVSSSQAALKVPSIFSDHMVLQSGVEVPVWGTTDAGKKVTVSIADQTKTVEAGPDGKWMVKLDPLKSAEELSLKIESGNTITIADVLVGEVWLCSGQSNMVLQVSKAKDFETEKAAAKWPKIRTFTTKWVACSPETVANFSAVAYFFGREIHEKTGQPVGLICRAAGGSPIEMWTNWDVQKEVAELKPILDAAIPAASVDPGVKDAAQAESDRKQALEVEGKQAAAGQKRPPGFLFDDRILPLIPYAIRGAIWYQGEANSYTANANLYGKQLALMITDWRKRWGYDFPFISVQLPELGKPQSTPVEESGRAWVRDGVLQSLKLPATGLAVTLGTGEEANNHPKDKQEAGRRLALWALATTYGKKDVAASGPLPAGSKVEGDKIVVRFTHADGGLVAKGGDLKGFAIAGSDKNWIWADAKIAGDTVVVSSPGVKQPVAVRYAWAGNPAGSNLTNGAGLPASPFRTDE